MGLGFQLLFDSSFSYSNHHSYYSCYSYHNCHHSHKLQRAFNKYGEENFDFIYEEYQIDSQQELFCREVDMINYYNSYYDGYNETLGGENAITTSKITDEDLYRIIQMLIENILSEQDIAKQTGYSIGTISEINQGHI